MASVAKIKPLFDYLLVEPTQKDTTLPSGIVIPDTAKEKPLEGRVVAVGSGKRDDSGNRIPMEIKAGDTVMFKKWGGTDIKLDGKDMLLIKQEDILAIVEG
ncbi:co-chaperone GroES [candidate division WWE3 bacterium RIFOXYB1_FULL_43_24]|uniref:Co-chaperonin GroES n=1 Tax=candidate division WWE3 bacterium GW2011_GWF1_42_14 TaxID=1619138 RepID=A0A0G0YLC0_UNCKA|nr:MAG: 10 kDa chaperonin [candidate division WWE3 bacterium GW2011_GWA1_42_12]KKS37582.1 MAG: 10 kDa chaperonin [candidate division WWE3 bacterium GW2011_GWF1_42_14]OGC58722.1 MAG: co-chaperone GroES [candidate division WWE3 bacterium RIFOXYA1_FULL_42_9]OGC69061.1 MAG: co-chaperone GroES [candidate division WWE3 bacterium RIFOXYB1_FULL_43_24]OGC72237.1 MAG: co-chaperone GroES [candidate division WWE3 bacterium RIFOXYC1_FULL_42_13]